MKGAISVLAIVVLIAAASARNFYPTPTPTPYCNLPVPGLKYPAVHKQCSPTNCHQGCNEKCELVTSHACEGDSDYTPGMSNIVHETDITCNKDDWGVECVLCKCPDLWKGVIPGRAGRALSNALVTKLTGKLCYIGNIKRVKLTCGEAPEKAPSSTRLEVDEAERLGGSPSSYPFQCKNSISKKCIKVDRSFEGVKIIVKQTCSYHGAPLCKETVTKIDTTCKKCDAEKNSLWSRTGFVFEKEQTCLDGSGQCKLGGRKVDIIIPGCTDACVHAPGPKCNMCKGYYKLFPRKAPLCVVPEKSLFVGCPEKY